MKTEIVPSGFHDAIMRSIPDGGIVVPVGSRVTCSPPPMDTDEDYVVLVKDKGAAVKSLREFGFETPVDLKEAEEYEKLAVTSQWSFASLRLGSVNYIVTDSPFFFERFLTATYVVKKLNLLSKEDRITVFEAIRGVSFANDIFPGAEAIWRELKIQKGKAHPETERGLDVNVIVTTDNQLF